MVVLLASRSTSVDVPERVSGVPRPVLVPRGPPEPAQAVQGEAPKPTVTGPAQELRQAITRHANALDGLCGIRTTTECAEEVCAMVHDISPSPVWVFWESPTILFAAATFKAGLPDVTGCAGAIEGVDTVGEEVCHYRSRVHGDAPNRKILCSAFAVTEIGSSDVIAACNRAGHAALGVAGLFDDRRPFVGQAGNCRPE